MRNTLLLAMFCLLFSSLSYGGELFEKFPEVIQPDEKYVFYSHGYIVEGLNPTPKHKTWGVYDFPLIKQKLTDPDYNLIAYHRAAQTNPYKFAKKLGQDVNRLISAGVKTENITLIGFSRGGAISILTSNELKLEKVSTIILAGCAGLIKSNPDVQIYGDVLSIFETSDQVGSCNFLINRSTNVSSFHELSISTGKSHGAFYEPKAEWLIPVKNWIKTNGD